MPLKEYQVSSYGELCNLLEKTQGEGEEIFLFFSCTLDKHGDPTTKTCFNAEDVLMEYTEYIRASKRQLHLFYYRVMLEEYFKPDCEVNKDRNLRITTVPTLLKWKSKLTGDGVECQNKFPLFRPCTFFKPKEKVEEVQLARLEEENASTAYLNKGNDKEETEKLAEASIPLAPESAGDGQSLKSPSGPKPATENVAEGEMALKDQNSNPME